MSNEKSQSARSSHDPPPRPADPRAPRGREALAHWGAPTYPNPKRGADFVAAINSTAALADAKEATND